MNHIFFIILLFIILPTYAQVNYDKVLSSDKGTLSVGIKTPANPKVDEETILGIEFINPVNKKIQEHIDYRLVVTKDGINVFGPIPLTHTSTVADWERQNPVFKEAVNITITPLLLSLTLLQYADINTEAEMLGYGVGIILLNIVMYFVAPPIIILKLKPVLRTKLVQ